MTLAPFTRTDLGGDGPHGPIIVDTIDAVTGSIAFVVDPRMRRRGCGRRVIGTVVLHPDLRAVKLFEAGVEPDNAASRRCLEATGLALGTLAPDFEGMLYYRLARGLG